MIKSTPAFCQPYLPATVDSVLPGGPGEKIGLKKGNKLLALNGVKITSANVFLDELSKMREKLSACKTHQDSMKIRTAQLVYQSDKVDTAKAVLTPDLKFAIEFPSMLSLYTPTHKSYSFLASFPAGVAYGWDVLKGYVSDMKYVFSASGAKSLGGLVR